LLFALLSLAAATLVTTLPESAGRTLADVPDHACAAHRGGGGKPNSSPRDSSATDTPETTPTQAVAPPPPGALELARAGSICRLPSARLANGA
jgi:hypothetical protein